MKRFLLVGLSALAMAGCTVGPNYHKPQVKAPAQWRTTQPPAESQVTMAMTGPQWWTLFNDPILTRLENEVASANLDLRAASLRLMQSVAERRIASAAQLPHAEANASYARERASTNGVLGLLGTMEREGAGSIASGTQGFGPTAMPGSVGNPSFNLPQYGMNASWEVDLWGHVRRQVEAATAAMHATEEMRRDTLVSLMAETAQDYIDLRATQVQLGILEHNIAVAENSVRLTTLRFEQGAATRLDVAEATGQLHTFTSRLAPLKAQVTHRLNALSFLVAREPGALDAALGPPGMIPVVPSTIPVGLPSQLAERRPDIRMAADRLHAATASIGVAIADFFPRITLSGSLDVQALQFSGLGSWASRQYGFGPTATLPIFEGGRLTGQLHLRRAQQKEAATMFQRTVLKAWQEIDDAMADFTAAQRRRDELTEAVHENEIAVDTAKAQYVQGSSDFLNVLTLQNALLSSQSAEADATAHVALSVTNLYRAVGGGWESLYPEKQKKTRKHA
ncbi:efflux transporter outer membrane subunit [Komagataeibacter sucrofermentans]|uniref:Secretion protein n=1 Tax=Komagataeibacter sucrofermentans TaxID=1053551 RepID=A0A318QRX6_9PROT|nr:efflux transporter outer membrane subunit [Komagataeibacter sucrofermentans]PYD80091.1 secretion protein [Komagataeibacter sucrofermentans]GBQ48632.1 secretion system type I outer membrane efflux pump lipoprotein NodT [Komagataeibacter sucrofermentans DSM 15973]